MDILSKLGNQPLSLIVVMVLLSLLPLLVVIGTSFLKISIVLSILRNALGIQQVPPNMAIYGISLILTLFIMTPVGYQISDNIEKNPVVFQTEGFFSTTDRSILEPYKDFLNKHTDPKQKRFFSRTATQMWPEELREKMPQNSIFVMLPAFMVSQLVESFKIGLLLYLPFIAIDLIVSNILLAMGMMMVSPMTISLPFKILIFVLIGGWDKLFTQLILSYK